MATEGCATEVSLTENKIFFDVPFERKEMAKAAGLRWDNTRRKWYAISPEIADAFSGLLKNNIAAPVATERHYFNVPFLQKDRAKAMGLRFDGSRKLWYAPNSFLALDAAQFFKKLDEPTQNSTDFP